MKKSTKPPANSIGRFIVKLRPGRATTRRVTIGLLAVLAIGFSVFPLQMPATTISTSFWQSPFVMPEVQDETGELITETLGDFTCTYHSYSTGANEAARIAETVQQPTDTAIAIRDYNNDLTCLANPDRLFFTASTIKVATVAAMFWQAEQAGIEPSNYLLNLASLAITISDNDAQQAIWVNNGDAPAMNQFFQLAGMTSSTASYDWGMSTTTAPDYLKLIDELVNHTLISAEHSEFLLDLMSEVAPEQAWGVSGGAPDDASVMLKNGWLYIFDGQVPGGNVTQFSDSVTWTLNSGGYIHSNDASYAMVILSEHNPSYEPSAEKLTELSSDIAAAILASG